LVNPETMWGCPDCLAGLRHELAQAEAARVEAERQRDRALATNRHYENTLFMPGLRPTAVMDGDDAVEVLPEKVAEIIAKSDLQAAEISALRAALEEALNAWEGFGKTARMDRDWQGWERISKLRAALKPTDAGGPSNNQDA